MYHESERLVFGPYHRGDGVEIYADPLAVNRAIVKALKGDHNRVLAELSHEVEDVRLEAEGQAVDAARPAFGMHPFDPETGAGVTDKEVLDVLCQFCEYLEQKKSQLGN